MEPWPSVQHVGNFQKLPATAIYFSQVKVSRRFTDGSSLRRATQDFCSGRADAFPPIRVGLIHGQWFSVDNRRLTAAKMASKCTGREVYINVEFVDVKQFPHKFDTISGGTSVEVRGTGCSVLWNGDIVPNFGVPVGGALFAC